VTEIAEKHGGTAEPIVSGEPFLTPPGAFSDLLAAAIEAETGLAPELSTSGGTSDSRFLKDLAPVIDFVMNDGTRYRNTLAGRCPNLGFDQRFAYKTATSALCDVDTITVLPTGSSIPGPTCGLGKFAPVKLAGG
jgi:succinyl-diaminopimelate desuccinylase